MLHLEVHPCGMEHCLRNTDSFLVEKNLCSSEFCKLVVGSRALKRAPKEADDSCEGHRLALEWESISISNRIRHSALRDRVVALPRKGGEAAVVCQQAHAPEIHDFLAQMQLQFGITVDKAVRPSRLTFEESVEAVKRSVVAALGDCGWRELGVALLLKSDFLMAPTGKVTECMAASVDVCPLAGSEVGALMLTARSGVVRFRPWSLLDTLKNVNGKLAAELQENPDFWRDPCAVGRLNSSLQGVKCTVLPDCRPASICSVRKEHHGVVSFWLDSYGYQLPRKISHYIDVTFDLDQCNDEATVTIPCCCAWSPSGLSYVNWKSRCGGHEKIMQELKASLTGVQNGLWGGGDMKLIDLGKTSEIHQPVQRHTDQTASHLMTDWCNASRLGSQNNQSPSLPEWGFTRGFHSLPMLDARHAGFEKRPVKVGHVSWTCQRHLGSWVKTSALLGTGQPLAGSEDQSKHLGSSAETGGFVKPKLSGVHKGGLPCQRVVSLTKENPPAPCASKYTQQPKTLMALANVGKANELTVPEIKMFSVIPKKRAPGWKLASEPPIKEIAKAARQSSPALEQHKGVMAKRNLPITETTAAACERSGKATSAVPNKKGGRPQLDTNPMPPPKKKQKAGCSDPTVIEAKVKELVEAGKKLGVLSVAEMKCFLKLKGLPVGGKKAILQERIGEFVAKGLEP